MQETSKDQPISIDLWPFDIESVDQERALSTLSEAEHERAAGYSDPTAQQVFTACRGELRQILSIYLNIAPSVIPIAITPSGKPVVDQVADGNPSIQFNLSHAGGLGMIAVTRGQEVGVDVQPHDPDRPIMDIAKRFFTPREYEHLSSLPGDQVTIAFYSLWSRKEALVKAVGSSLGSKLTDLEVLGDGGLLTDLAKVGEDSTRTFAATDLRTPAGYSGAVAIELTNIPLNKAAPIESAISLDWRIHA